MAGANMCPTAVLVSLLALKVPSIIVHVTRSVLYVTWRTRGHTRISFWRIFFLEGREFGVIVGFGRALIVAASSDTSLQRIIYGVPEST